MASKIALIVATKVIWMARFVMLLTSIGFHISALWLHKPTMVKILSFVWNKTVIPD